MDTPQFDSENYKSQALHELRLRLQALIRDSTADEILHIAAVLKFHGIER
jgi:hypothetical protein